MHHSIECCRDISTASGYRLLSDGGFQTDGIEVPLPSTGFTSLVCPNVSLAPSHIDYQPHLEEIIVAVDGSYQEETTTEEGTTAECAAIGCWFG
jgi:hypothetical protein